LSFASLLINECTVQEYSAGTADDYGIPAKTWTDFATDEPCRLVPATNREVQIGAEVVIADYTLFIDNIGVTEQMRVVIDEITYEVLSVMIRQDSVDGHHQEALLRTVR
jgi:hypothetical protein